MEAKELRVNNLIYDKLGRVVKVISIDNSDIEESTYKFKLSNGNILKHHIRNTNGIPLTEEWLLKFGFKRYEGLQDDLYELDGFWQIQKDFNSNIYTMSDIELYNIKYVHQLQNLYFALTGQELTIK